jgi:hypothetical protein
MGAQDASRWVPLTYYLRLKNGRQPALAMTFRQIEAVLGDGLPKPARTQREWWRNDAALPQAQAWLAAGWQVSEVDLSNERVTFVTGPAPGA